MKAIASIKQNQPEQCLMTYFQDPQNTTDIFKDLSQRMNTPMITDREKFLKYNKVSASQIREHENTDNEGHKLLEQEFQRDRNGKIILQKKSTIANNSLVEFSLLESYRKTNQLRIERKLNFTQEEKVYERIVFDQNDNKQKQTIQKNTLCTDGTIAISKLVINHLDDGGQTIREYYLDNFFFLSVKHINQQGKELESETRDTLLNENVQTKIKSHQGYKAMQKIISSLRKTIYIQSKFEIQDNNWEREIQQCQRFTQTIYRISYIDTTGTQIQQEKIGNQYKSTKFVKANYGPDYTQEITENQQTRAVKNTYQNQKQSFQYIYSYQYHNSKDKILSQSIKYRNGMQITMQQEIRSSGTSETKRLIYQDLCGNYKARETYQENGNQIVEINESENGNDQQYQEYIDSTSIEKQLIKLEEMNVSQSQMKHARQLAQEKQQIEANIKENQLRQNYLPIIKFRDENLYENIEKQIKFWDQKYKIGYQQHLQ